jgi:hypothetical protein
MLTRSWQATFNPWFFEVLMNTVRAGSMGQITRSWRERGGPYRRGL